MRKSILVIIFVFSSWPYADIMATGSFLVETQTKLYILADSLEIFRLDVGRYPTEDEGLKALLSSPPGLKEKWQGPYIHNERHLTDL